MAAIPATYGIYAQNAIMDKTLWNYRSIDKTTKVIAIVLEHNGLERTLFARINKDGAVQLGEDRNNLINYSTIRTNHPEFKNNNVEILSSPIFQLDTATYSGFFKGYSTRFEKKTGMIYVRNVLTGNQDSHLVKIADDGTFSVRFPLYQPQHTFVRLPYGNFSIFVEPGKETFHLINTGKNNSLFMGDVAQTNTDLELLKSISPRSYSKVRNNILQTSPEDYKDRCIDIMNKEFEKLDELCKVYSISKKALQIKKLDIKYTGLSNIFGYDIYSRSALLRFQRDPKNKDLQPPEKFDIPADFFDFISEKELNDELATVSQSYSQFINYMMFFNTFRLEINGQPSTLESAQLLQKSGIEITSEEWEMIEASKKIETPEHQKKQLDFQRQYGREKSNFLQKHSLSFKKSKKTSQESYDPVLAIADFLQETGVELTKQEKELVDAARAMYSPEEVKRKKEFAKEYGAVKGDFLSAHKTLMNKLMRQKYTDYRESKMRDIFGTDECFVFDVITAQEKCRILAREFTPFSESELQEIQEQIRHPFISEYISIENDKTIAKIEVNKTKTGFKVHDTPKTEADLLFDSMMAKFRGKVVYVDFWATWCGPCISGIKRIAPLKEEMKDEDVVFVYITNQTSPENAWQNRIPDIKGEHYRVSSDEWNYLSQKFNISGIPHYTLVNKEGEVVKPHLGHQSNEALKKLLESYM